MVALTHKSPSRPLCLNGTDKEPFDLAYESAIFVLAKLKDFHSLSAESRPIEKSPLNVGSLPLFSETPVTFRRYFYFNLALERVLATSIAFAKSSFFFASAENWSIFNRLLRKVKSIDKNVRKIII